MDEQEPQEVIKKYNNWKKMKNFLIGREDSFKHLSAKQIYYLKKILLLLPKNTLDNINEYSISQNNILRLGWDLEIFVYINIEIRPVDISSNRIPLFRIINNIKGGSRVFEENDLEEMLNILMGYLDQKNSLNK